LILGAAGFIGSHLVRRLTEGGQFDNLVLAGYGVSERYAGLGIPTIDGFVDRHLLDQCEIPDVVIFLAGGASVGVSIQDPAGDFRISIPSLVDLLEKLRASWCGTHLVFVSSAAVYGVSGSRATRTDSPLRPISPYGLHKLQSEALIDFDRTRGSLAATVLRPFSVYGPNLRKQLLWDALSKAAAGDYRFFGTGSELRDWVYVEDLVDLLIDVALWPDRFPALLNAGTGVGTPVDGMLSLLYRVCGCRHRPEFMCQGKPGDPDHLVASPDEQAPYLSYFKTGIDTGVERYVDWYRMATK
jgi:UDP-glucose 4-epimerase